MALQQSRVAAVVVTYNRLPLLRRCLQAIVEQRGAQADLWVIDNASTDGTEDELRRWSPPRLFYQNTGRNLGGAGGFAYGVRAAASAGYDYLWLMDDDTIPEPDALAALLSADVRLSGQYGWLSSRALTPQGQDQPMNRQRLTPYRDIQNYEGDMIPSQMASFVSLFVRGETVRAYGLPIAEFFIWSDDWEYTRRISRQLPCYTVPSSKVVHAMKSNTVVNIAADEPGRWERYRYFYRNDVYLYRREGFAGWLWLLCKFAWHSVQVLRSPAGHRLYRLGVIWKGFAAGIGFDPPVRGIED